MEESKSDVITTIAIQDETHDCNYYRNTIEQGLKDYAEAIGETHPDQLYKDLSWGGLKGTNAWNNMFADPVFTANEQTRILTSINNFITTGNNECN